MKIYRAIIWISLLLVIVEVLVLSDFEIAPLKSELTGQVLGVSTDSILEDLANQSFPASYYTTPEAIGDNFLNPATATLSVDESAPAMSESATAPLPQPEDVDTMVEWLNGGGSATARPDAPVDVADRVPSLINKNKRLYLQTLRREIDQIKAQFAD